MPTPRATRHHHLVALAALLLIPVTHPAAADSGTRAQRDQLFDFLLAKTLARTAFSPEKPRALGLPAGVSMAEHVAAEMTRLKPLLLQAETDMELFWALSAISNVRRDQHVWITPTEGGIEIDTELYGPRGDEIGHVPVKFKPDYGDGARPAFFVSDVAENFGRYATDYEPQIGDVLVSVNGRPTADYVADLSPYLTSSTDAMLMWSVSNTLPVRFFGVPPAAYRDDGHLLVSLRSAEGHVHETRLPYVPYRDIPWVNYEGHTLYGTDDQRAEPRALDPYSEYDQVFAGSSFDLYRHRRGGGPLLVRWHRFRGSLLEEIPRLLNYAEAEGLMDAGLIWDGTASTGGSRGAWTLQRLQPQPFKMTFGNLRVSDVTQELADALRDIAQQNLEEAGNPPRATHSARDIQTLDPGHYLLEWVTTGIQPAIDAAQAYTNDVPFMAYFLPPHSDGWVYPADRHLTGPMAMILGPYGCSHLDQFAAMFIDNGLGYSTGMPAGGCSNTLEYQETLTFPGTETPIVEYAWTVGQTIRPNGQVLEGNPAMVEDYVPLTRRNYRTYARDLVRRAEQFIETAKAAR